PPPRPRPSFPTRRSSDLAQRLPRPPPAARGESPRRHASEQMLDDRSGDVARRRFLQAAPSGDPVDLDYVRRAVTRGQEIDAGVDLLPARDGTTRSEEHTSEP